jgi:hypothetical protein
MTPLTPHPDSHCAAVTSLEAEAVRDGAGLLRLRYVLNGAMSAVSLPPITASVRTDELWRRTCFEAFVEVGEGYYELNLAPSTQWAAYCFDGYRQGMRPAPIDAPRIEVRRTGDSLELRALVSGLPGGPWRIGLSAVVEEASGGLSYWALRHLPGKPDFHHRDCFALELPETARP